MKTTLHRIAALSIITIGSLTASALPPIYMDFDGIPGIVTAANGHAQEIEIHSWGAGNPAAAKSNNRVQGNYIGTDASGCNHGPFKFTVKGTPSAQMKQLCESRKPLGNVTVDVNGTKHRLENASFSGCQTGNGSVPTDQFSMNFSKCSYHGGLKVAVGDVNDGAVRPNARLIGLSTGPVDGVLQNLRIDPATNSATMSFTKAGTGTLILSGASTAPLPQLVLELTSGEKWTFLEVKMTNILISGATGQRPADQFLLNFTKIQGSTAGYPAR
jgi:type VI protein secretion system component Hcp